MLTEFADSIWRNHPLTSAMVVTNGNWRPYAWLRYLAAIVFKAVMQGGGRLIVTVPPRVGKSLFLSVLLPVWYLENFPQDRIILTTYSAELSTSFGRRIRDIFSSSDLLQTRIRQDSHAASRFDTQAGGGMIATGSHGPITGKGGNLVLIDDPHKSFSDAHSLLKTDRVWDWYQGTLLTRLEPDATAIILMQRWSTIDLVAHLLNEYPGEYEHVSLPALCVGDGDPLGRKIGEPICPERYSADDYHRIEKEVGSSVWESCYQQNPSAVMEYQMFTNFLEQRHVKDRIRLVPGYPVDLSVDFNIDPSMMFILGQEYPSKDFLVDIAEFHGDRMDIPTGARLIAESLKEQQAFDWMVELRVFGDASGHHESPQTGKSDYDVLIAHLKSLLPESVQIVLDVPRAAPSVRDSVNAFNDALLDPAGRPHYAVAKQCTELIRDMEHMKWTPEGTVDKRDKHRSHAADAARYRIARLRPIQSFRPPEREAPTFVKDKKPSAKKKRARVRVPGKRLFIAG